MKTFDEFFKKLGLDNLEDLTNIELEEELDKILCKFDRVNYLDQASTIEALIKDNSKLRAELAKKDLENGELHNLLGSSANPWDSCVHHVTLNADNLKIAELVEANKGLKLRIKELEAMVDYLNETSDKAIDEVKALKNEKEQLQEDYDSVVLKNQELAFDLETAKSFENKDILKQLRVAQNALQEKIKEKNRLWNQLQDVKDKLANTAGSLEASEACKEQYKKDAEKWELLYRRLTKVNDESQTLINSLRDDKIKLKNDQEYLLNRAKKAEARVDELIKENNELHDQVVFNTIDLLDDCEELEADYIPGINIECETLNLTINNWPEPFEEDEEDEEE